MNAINLLKQQHQEVRDLFEQLEQAEDASEKETIIQELADNLAAHMTIEEQIFYPAVFRSKNDAGFTEAVDEHLGVKRILADLLVMSPDDDNFEDKVTMLQERVENHVEEEESEVFKTAKKILGSEDLKRLGAEMRLLFDEEMAGHPSNSLPEQTAEVAPSSWLSAGR